MIVSRPDKLSHGQTLLYEIDMFRFAAGRLQFGKLHEEDQWVYLEDFLLHYRNLIDFLGHDDPRPNDLHISKPDFLDRARSPDDLTLIDKLNATGGRLWKDGDTGPDIITKYLHHCTKNRIDSKTWPVGAMNDGLEPLLHELEGLLKHVTRSNGSGRCWRAHPAVQFLGRASIQMP